MTRRREMGADAVVRDAPGLPWFTCPSCPWVRFPWIRRPRRADRSSGPLPAPRIDPVWLVGCSTRVHGPTMTHQSGVPRYLRRPRQRDDAGPPSRLPAVRVRTWELRLIGVAVAGCWLITGLLLLIGYRPGGPVDVVVGLAALLPALVAIVGVRWPPVARGDQAFAAMVWLALGSL